MKETKFIQNKKTGVVLQIRPVDDASDLMKTGNYVASNELTFDLYQEKRTNLLEALLNISRAIRRLDDVNDLEMSHGTNRLGTTKMLLGQIKTLEILKEELNEHRKVI